jgi:RNA polymerase sigma-70 factor (ECF subfamily)
MAVIGNSASLTVLRRTPGRKATAAAGRGPGRTNSPESRHFTLAKHSEDMALVRRIADGDVESFEAFGDRYSPALYRFVLGKLNGNRELALEIVQTALVKALAKLETYRGGASLLTWLCACCRNEMLMHFRRQATTPVHVGLEDRLEPASGVAAGHPNAEAALLRREEARQVHVTLDSLPRHYAQVLEWKYVERLPVKEIAGRLGLAPKAAESLLTRARQAFRKSFEELRAETRDRPARTEAREE